MRLTAALMVLYLALTALLATQVDRRFFFNDLIAVLVFTVVIAGLAIGARWTPSSADGPDGPPDERGGWTPPAAPLPSTGRLPRAGHRGETLAPDRPHRSHQHRRTRTRT